MKDWIIKAAEELYDNIEDIDEAAGQEGQLQQDSDAERDSWIGQVHDLIEQHAPAWHPRPTCRGLWLDNWHYLWNCEMRGGVPFVSNGRSSSVQIPVNCTHWYGPIPQREAQDESSM